MVPSWIEVPEPRPGHISGDGSGLLTACSAWLWQVSLNQLSLWPFLPLNLVLVLLSPFCSCHSSPSSPFASNLALPRSQANTLRSLVLHCPTLLLAAGLHYVHFNSFMFLLRAPTSGASSTSIRYGLGSDLSIWVINSQHTVVIWARGHGTHPYLHESSLHVTRSPTVSGHCTCALQS